MPILITFIQHNIGSLSHKRQGKKKKESQLKRRGKPLLFANIKIPAEYDKFIDWINEIFDSLGYNFINGIYELTQRNFSC